MISRSVFILLTNHACSHQSSLQQDTFGSHPSVSQPVVYGLINLGVSSFYIIISQKDCIEFKSCANVERFTFYSQHLNLWNIILC